MTALPQRK